MNKVALLGSTGAVGGQCLSQLLEQGYSVRVLVRDANKLAPADRERVELVEGNALQRDDIERLLDGIDHVLFAIGVDKHSPEDLCTDVTRHVLEVLRSKGGGRFIWCGGGSTLVEQDQITFGARFVNFYAKHFLGLRHRDKDHQYALLQQYQDIDWVGVRPLQIRDAEKTQSYEVGFIPFSGASWISFADVAHAMISMLDNDDWLRQAPVVRY